MEDVERIIFTGQTARGETARQGSDILYGLTNYPNANSRNVSDWADADTPAKRLQVVSDVIQMMKDAKADNFHGPFNLYVTPGALGTLHGRLL